MENNAPILEFDDAAEALLEPSKLIEPIDIPERCVLTFFSDVIASVQDTHHAQIIHTLRSEIGPNPIYKLDVDGVPVAFTHPGVGAPLAAGFLEELIAFGARKFIVCGGAGVLDGKLDVGHVVVPTAAVRDEGTSYHYLPPSRDVLPHPDAVAAIEAALTTASVPFVTGKTWTTDGIYRETPGRIARRKAEGCITVEMEASALFAVAQFRDVPLGQLLYGGDDVSGDIWDSRGWQSHTSVREKLFWLAVDAVLKL